MLPLKVSRVRLSFWTDLEAEILQGDTFWGVAFFVGKISGEENAGDSAEVVGEGEGACGDEGLREFFNGDDDENDGCDFEGRFARR